jgi:hypothetical protein
MYIVSYLLRYLDRRVAQGCPILEPSFSMGGGTGPIIVFLKLPHHELLRLINIVAHLNVH